METTTIPKFKTREAAIDWMCKAVGTERIENVRFANVEDKHGMQRYEAMRRNGVNEFFDTAVMVGRKKYLLGCNYGH